MNKPDLNAPTSKDTASDGNKRQKEEEEEEISTF